MAERSLQATLTLGLRASTVTGPRVDLTEGMRVISESMLAMSVNE